MQAGINDIAKLIIKVRVSTHKKLGYILYFILFSYDVEIQIFFIHERFTSRVARQVRQNGNLL